MTNITSPKAKRTASNGWINVQLDEELNAKLRRMVDESRPKVSLTAVVESAVEREWVAWSARRVAAKGVAS